MLVGRNAVELVQDRLQCFRRRVWNSVLQEEELFRVDLDMDSILSKVLIDIVPEVIGAYLLSEAECHLDVLFDECPRDYLCLMIG